MIDPTSIYVDNFFDALRQINRYLALGLSTSISALIVDRRPRIPAPSPAPQIPLPAGLGSASPETAVVLLMALSFVAGLMGYYAALSASRIGEQLRTGPDILQAACTFASAGTAPVGLRILACTLPIVFILVIVWRHWRLVHASTHQEAPGGFIALFGFFATPYVAFALMLTRIPCKAL